MTKDDIKLTSLIWGLSVRSTERWLEAGAPLRWWWAVPDWSATLSAKTRCKLTPAFERNIYAAGDLRFRPNPGSVACMMWWLGATASERQGSPMPIPRGLMEWLERFVAGKFVPPKITNPELGQRMTGDTLAEHVGFFQNRSLCPDDFKENPKFIENWIVAAHANRSAA